MTTCFSCIVEGFGDQDALPVLLRRIAFEIDPAVSVTVPKPIRVPKAKLLKHGELERYVELAWRRVDTKGGILVLVDADEHCPATVGPEMLLRAQLVRADAVIGVILAKREFEGWFLASASSLAGMRGLPEDLEDAADPEGVGDAKGWLKARMHGKYSETLDQAALAARFDLARSRERSPSFDKCWREVERIIAA